jgi:hypothetical protein
MKSTISKRIQVLGILTILSGLFVGCGTTVAQEAQSVRTPQSEDGDSTRLKEHQRMKERRLRY